MLKTIHVPKNLTQLSDLLPAPKYGDPVPKQTFERSRSTQKVIERVGSRERKTIVEMAQAIKLPPIKEQELSDLQIAAERCSSLHQKMQSPPIHKPESVQTKVKHAYKNSQTNQHSPKHLSDDGSPVPGSIHKNRVDKLKNKLSSNSHKRQDFSVLD